MVARVPLMTHGSARDALIIGGGDGGALGMVCDRLSVSFPEVKPYFAPVPTDVGGMLALGMNGSRDALSLSTGVLLSCTGPRSRCPTFAPACWSDDPSALMFLETGT